MGGEVSADTPKGYAVKHASDGQNVSLSLFVSLEGLLKREEQDAGFPQFWVDLIVNEDEEIVLLEAGDSGHKRDYSAEDLLSGHFADLASFPKDLQDKICMYKNRIESYQFSAILMKDAAIDVATEVFTRLNVGGEPLSVFEIMVAKTYDPDKDFDLAEKFKALTTELRRWTTTLCPQLRFYRPCLSSFERTVARRHILNLPRHDVMKEWPKAIEAIGQASTISVTTTAYRCHGYCLIQG